MLVYDEDSDPNYEAGGESETVTMGINPQGTIGDIQKAIREQEKRVDHYQEGHTRRDVLVAKLEGLRLAEQCLTSGFANSGAAEFDPEADRRYVDKKPVPRENDYGNMVWDRGESLALKGIEVQENGGKIVVNVEVAGFVPGITGPTFVFWDETGWVTLDLDLAKAEELRDALDQAIREHHVKWA